MLRMVSKLLRSIKWLVLGIIMLAISALLYSHFISYPQSARKECDQYAREVVSEKVGISAQEVTYDLFYKSCFRQKGLELE